MADRMTSIRLPGSLDPGYADWGRKSAEEMVAQYRLYAQLQLDWAKEVLASEDEDFCIDTYVGVHVQRKREIIQEGRKP